jgi:methylthioribose-1-phosphate isomerase
MIKNIEWLGNALRIIDQTEIPHSLVYIKLHTISDVFEAIQSLRIRGAPAIGIAAAFGLYLGIKNKNFEDKASLLSEIRQHKAYLIKARPTAVNLMWALETITKKIEQSDESPAVLTKLILEHANLLQKDDENRCKKIGQFGADLITSDMNILTHCNTGILATAGIGTALGILYTAWQQGKKFTVYVDETRPLLQGARLTMWELHQAQIPAILISDSAAAYAMKKGKIQIVFVGADRIASNGDVANKIGTYNLAMNCRYHDVPFYVAAPLSTFDFSLQNGDEIPIEQRSSQEISRIWDKLDITVPAAEAWNPAFDVTPAELIDGIITETSMFTYPFENSFRSMKLFSNLIKN